MKSISTKEAIVIGRRNSGEADRVITLLTKDGKIQVVAKGIRKQIAKRKSHVELFNTIKAQIIVTKNRNILAQTAILFDRSKIKTHLKLMRIAYHLVEVTNRLLPEQVKHPELFTLLNRALTSINLDTWKDETRLVTAYESKLLRLLGYGTPENQSPQSYIEELSDSRLKSYRILQSTNKR